MTPLTLTELEQLAGPIDRRASGRQSIADVRSDLAHATLDQITELTQVMTLEPGTLSSPARRAASGRR